MIVFIGWVLLRLSSFILAIFARENPQRSILKYLTCHTRYLWAQYNNRTSGHRRRKRETFGEGGITQTWQVCMVHALVTVP
jgi:hypothetical protein